MAKSERVREDIYLVQVPIRAGWFASVAIILGSSSVALVDAVDERFQDGDTLELGDRTFTVIHTPGHRPGNICLYDSTDKLLLTGDTVCGERKDLIRMGKEPQIASLNKLSQLSIDTMVMAHPFQPVGKTVLNGAEAQKMISDSIAIAEQL